MSSITFSETFYDASVKVLPPCKYTKAVAKDGSCILYEQQDFNQDPTPAKAQVIQLSRVPKPVVLQFQPMSLREVTADKGGIQLFQYSNYGGHTKDYNGNETTLPYFPSGASAAYLPGPNKWNLYTKPNYRSVPVTVDEGFYPSLADMGIPSGTVHSIKKLD